MSRVVLIFEHTRLDLEVSKEGTKDSVSRKYEKAIFESGLLAPDKTYKAELARVRRCIMGCGQSVVECLRNEVQSFVFRDDDMVVILGDDGAFVNTAKLLQNQRVITIATSTKCCSRLMKFTAETFEKSAVNLFAGKSAVVGVSLTRAQTSLGHTLEAVNDLFVGRADLRSSRYAVLVGSNFVEQVSSGVIVSTGTGSTGWEKSACALDSEYRERDLDDPTVTVVTRELCQGESLGVMRRIKKVTFRSNDNDTRIIGDGVLVDASMLLLPAGATVTITSNVRAVRLCI